MEASTSAGIPWLVRSPDQCEESSRRGPCLLERSNRGVALRSGEPSRFAGKIFTFVNHGHGRLVLAFRDESGDEVIAQFPICGVGFQGGFVFQDGHE